MDEIKTKSALLDTGEIRVGFDLTEEHIQSLIALNNSPHWKVYREMLLKAKTEFFNGVLPLKDPCEITKQVGMVAGINFAINQLPVLVSDHMRKLEKAARIEEEKAQGVVFKRG